MCPCPTRRGDRCGGCTDLLTFSAPYRRWRERGRRCAVRRAALTRAATIFYNTELLGFITQGVCMLSSPGRVLVVGGGAAGAMTVAALLRRAAADRTPVDITLVERSAAVGPGLAYGTTEPLLLLNNYAGAMSAVDDDPRHLVRWCVAEGLDVTDATFLPRATYGPGRLEAHPAARRGRRPGRPRHRLPGHDRGRSAAHRRRRGPRARQPTAATPPGSGRRRGPLRGEPVEPGAARPGR